MPVPSYLELQEEVTMLRGQRDQALEREAALNRQNLVLDRRVKREQSEKNEARAAAHSARMQQEKFQKKWQGVKETCDELGAAYNDLHELLDGERTAHEQTKARLRGGPADAAPGEVSRLRAALVTEQIAHQNAKNDVREGRRIYRKVMQELRKDYSQCTSLHRQTSLTDTIALLSATMGTCSLL